MEPVRPFRSREAGHSVHLRRSRTPAHTHRRGYGLGRPWVVTTGSHGRRSASAQLRTATRLGHRASAAVQRHRCRAHGGRTAYRSASCSQRRYSAGALPDQRTGNRVWTRQCNPCPDGSDGAALRRVPAILRVAAAPRPGADRLQRRSWRHPTQLRLFFSRL